jgi:S-DNA-T family DNA segregation ATPase FtsK/SpoIIIE
VLATGQASISYIQRRLKIGYNRAARIMEMMEEDRIVGPPGEAGKPREILRKRP